MLCFTPTANADFLVLQNKYQELKGLLANNAYQLPIYIASENKNEHQQGDIYGIIHHPFNGIKPSLTSPSTWCDIVPQHLNIKACTYHYQNNHCLLTFYSGRKYYQEPEDSFKLQYTFSVTSQQGNYIHSLLDAKDAPFGTSDYKIIIEAIPINDSSTFFHLVYSYKQGFWANFAMETYLSTLGRNKVGFTVIDKNENNEPVYVGGMRGVIERNVIRYYFAIQSYLNNLNVEPAEQFLARISNWFDLTEKYHEQLYELDKLDYIKYKLDERTNQLRLQKEINLNPAECAGPEKEPAR